MCGNIGDGKHLSETRSLQLWPPERCTKVFVRDILSSSSSLLALLTSSCAFRFGVDFSLIAYYFATCSVGQIFSSIFLLSWAVHSRGRVNRTFVGANEHSYAKDEPIQAEYVYLVNEDDQSALCILQERIV